MSFPAPFTMECRATRAACRVWRAVRSSRISFTAFLASFRSGPPRRSTAFSLRASAAAKDATASPAVTGPMTGAVAGNVAATGAEVAALPGNPMWSDPAGGMRTNPSPDTLVGLDQLQTRRLLGTPAATEEAPPAKVWHYAKGDCSLKVFFFMDMTSSQDFRALSYDLKSSENVPDVDKRCFAQLLAQGWDVRND